MRDYLSALLCGACAFTLIGSAPAQLIQLPPPPQLSPAGYQLILDYEVGGGQRYYELRLARPTWPGFASGVTIGIGYDLGYNSRAVIASDWQALPGPALSRLAATSGVTGAAANQRARDLRDILIAWDLSRGVFDRVTLTRFYQLAARTFPGLERLEPNAQAALVSLVFNRGSSMAGPRRSEMREIRDAVRKGDYRKISAAIRAMKRLWRGSDIEAGMSRRRDAEARLVDSCL